MAIRDRINLFSTPSSGNVRPTFSTTAPADLTVPWINITSRPYVLNYYYNGAWEPISGGVTSTSPTINRGSLSGLLTSTFGTASTPVTFTVAGTNMTAGILVTAPPYFEVSQTSGSGYASTTTVGAAGTIASTIVYVRLAATAPVNAYNSQSIVLTSNGATTANVTTASTGNSVTAVVVATPTITGGTISGALTTTSGTASSPANFTVSGANMTAGILVTAPTYFEVSLTYGGTYASTTTVGAAGTIASTSVYVRLAANAPVNTYNSQNIVLTSNGATSVNVTTLASGNSVSSSTLIAATLIVDPAGSDNSVLYTADTSGAGGNAISVAYAAPAAQATTTVAVAGNAITVTPGTKARMLVTGTLTSDGSTPYLIGRLLYAGVSNGKAKYSFNPSNPYELEGIFWNGSRWILGTIGMWHSTDPVATPDLVTTWVAQGNATGTPIVTAGISSAEQVITAVNNLDHAITGITASTSGLSTGAVAAVAAAYLTGGIGDVTTIPNAYTFNGDILTFQGNTLTFAA